MRNLVLFLGRDLRESLLEGRIVEDRVIAKAAGARRGKSDPAGYISFNLDEIFRAKTEAKGTNEAGLSGFWLDKGTHLLQKPGYSKRIVRRVPSGLHPGRPSECCNLQAGIIGQAGQTGSLVVVAGLEAGVGGESLAVFLDVGETREVGQ